MILVVGAGGLLGSRVVDRLRQRGLQVRAASRRPEERLRTAVAAGAEPVTLDLRDEASVRRAVHGVTTVVSAAHGLFPPTRSNTVVDVDQEGNRRLIDAATVAGVENFVLLSVRFAAAPLRHECRFGRAKHAAEEHLRTSGISGTILRPDAFTESHVLQLLGEPLRKSQTVRFMGSATTPLRFVSVDDVADVVTEATTAAPNGGVRLVGVEGPETLSRVEALAILEEVTGRTAKRRHVSLPMLRAVRTLSRPLYPGLAYMVDAFMAEEYLTPDTGDTDETVVTPTRVRDLALAWARDQA